MNSRTKFVIVMSSSLLVLILLLGTVLGQSVTQAGPGDPYRQIGVYTEVLSRIKSDYVEEPDLKSVTIGAINGLLESVDPYASYLNPEQFAQYQKQKDETRANAGLVLSKKYGYIGVVGVVPGSPAAKAGLTTGDMIEAIKGVTTRDMPLAYADLMLSGEPGSRVELSVLRFRRPEPQKVSLTRAVVKPVPPAARMLDNKIGYVAASTFEKGKAADVARAVLDLQKQGAEKLVLDVRGAAWGDPAEGFQVANLFLDKGLMGYVQGQKTPRQNAEAVPSRRIWSGPLVVITNRGTATGAEVAAAALLENKRADLVGERSYGDAAVRKTIPMDDGGAVILSVAKFYSPTGKAIQDLGVLPNVQMVETEPAVDADDETERPDSPSRKEDILLNKAIEVLTKGVTASSQGTPSPGRRPDDPTLGPLNIPRP